MAFKPLMPAEERRPRAGDDPHDRAFGKLISLREKVFGLLIRAIRFEEAVPDSIMNDLKWTISQIYFRREYDRLLAETASLEQRIDAYQASLSEQQSGN